MISHVDPHLLDIDINAVEHMLTDSIAFRISKDVYGEKLRPETAETSVAVPASWWQFFKHEKCDKWWMFWFVKRRPVRTNQIVMTATWENWVTYPWADLRGLVPESRFGPPVRQIRPPKIYIQEPPNFHGMNGKYRDNG